MKRTQAINLDPVQSKGKDFGITVKPLGRFPDEVGTLGNCSEGKIKVPIKAYHVKLVVPIRRLRPRTYVTGLERENTKDLM